MAAKIFQSNTTRANKLKTAQDRPIPIESHGANDGQIDAIIQQINLAANKISDTETKESIKELAKALSIIRENKTQFDSTRDNIEVLWNRVGTLVKEVVALKSAKSDQSTTVITDGSEDEDLFAYDLGGGIIITAGGALMLFDTIVSSDSSFDFTAGDASIEILKSGSFDIDFEFSVQLDPADVLQIRLQKYDGSTWEDITGALTCIEA